MEGTQVSDQNTKQNPTQKTKRKRALNANIKAELMTGMRMCSKCDKLLPLDQFDTRRRYYLCLPHLKQFQHENVLGTPEKRAYNSIRCRARADMILFKQKRIHLPMALVLSLLTKEQLQNSSTVCVIPKRPDAPLSKDNCVVVTSSQRRYIVARWKENRDADHYEAILKHTLSA
jgi:hypothetical protein